MFCDCFNNSQSVLLEWIQKNISEEITSLDMISFSNKYTSGTLTTKFPLSTNPSSRCIDINGYPHFIPPVNTSLDEIKLFTNKPKQAADSNLVIRFGDTHTDRPLPMLSQMRNIALAQSWNSVCEIFGVSPKLIFGLGDFGDRLYDHIDSALQLSSKSKAEIHSAFFGCSQSSNSCFRYWKQLSQKAKSETELFLDSCFVGNPIVVLESEILSVPDLLNGVVSKTDSYNLVRSDGSIPYLLNELVWLEFLGQFSENILCLITSNQIGHVRNVYNKLDQCRAYENLEYHIYELCDNGQYLEHEKWDEIYEGFWNYGRNLYRNLNIDRNTFYRILFIGNRNQCRINFNALSKYTAVFRKADIIFKAISLGLEHPGSSNEQMLMLMSLAKNRLKISCINKDFSFFFDYLFYLAKAGLTNGFCCSFLSKFLRLGLEYIGII